MKSVSSEKTSHGKAADVGTRVVANKLAEVVIGQDVLEIVSGGMHVDPMSVYREYVQNAADAVDEARAARIIPAHELGRVDIALDQGTRTVRIRDNGCGLPFSEFGRRLMAIGGSAKRGGAARGFRGVGRLAGLAYAQEVVFRSRGSGEKDVSELTWDCRRLRAGLREGPYDTSVAELVRDVTTIERTPTRDGPDGFFEVEMRGIVRLRNDRLMNPLAISQYLSQVAPVPFAPGFRFGRVISEALAPYVDLGGLHIRVGDADEPIYRPHRNSVSVGGNVPLSFDDIEVFELPRLNDGLSSIVWVLHHDYSGAIPPAALVKGFRLRAGDIQVGGHTLLDDLFVEPRFNSWTVGEVHVIDPRIVPNARRDDFEQNPHYYNLINHLSPIARDISRRCRTNSVRRKWKREFALLSDSAAESISIITQRSTGRSKRRQLALSIDQTILKMYRIASNNTLSDIAPRLRSRIESLRQHLADAMNDDNPTSSPLERLSESERRTYEFFFELIYECAPNRASAKALVDRILLRITPTTSDPDDNRKRPSLVPARLHDHSRQ